MSHDRIEDLNKGSSLLFALFHLDLENFTLSLIHHVVPALLQLPTSHLTLIMDPKGQVLASLCVMCLCTLHRMKQIQKGETRKWSKLLVN